jgi:hypothetical protein
MLELNKGEENGRKGTNPQTQNIRDNGASLTLRVEKEGFQS